MERATPARRGTGEVAARWREQVGRAVRPLRNLTPKAETRVFLRALLIWPGCIAHREEIYGSSMANLLPRMTSVAMVP